MQTVFSKDFLQLSWSYPVLFTIWLHIFLNQYLLGISFCRSAAPQSQMSMNIGFK